MIAMFFSQLLYWPTVAPLDMSSSDAQLRCYQHPHERCERCIANGNTQDQGRARTTSAMLIALVIGVI